MIKLIPILLILRETKYKITINNNDIYVSIYILLIYLIIMSILNKNPVIYYNMMIDTYLEKNKKKEYKSFISKSYDYIYSYIIDNINK